MVKDKKLKTDTVEYAYLQRLTSSKLEDMLNYILDCQAQQLPTYEQIRVLWFDAFKRGKPLKPIAKQKYIDKRNNDIYHVLKGFRDTNLSLVDSSVLMNRILGGELSPESIIHIYHNETNRHKEEKEKEDIEQLNGQSVQ